MESQIVKLINSTPFWREEIERLNIKVKEDHNLAIFNYGIDADFTNPIVREARGIIIDDKPEVVCWPFSKFCNFQEEAAKIDLEDFDWNNCRVEDKLDGSIVKLFFRPAEVVLDWLTIEPQGWWQWATNSCIDANNANVQNSDKTYLDIIKSAANYKDIPFDSLDKNLTYIFELVSPQTQVVVKYPCAMLYHIGTRNNHTGEEYRVDIGIRQPDTYDIHSLEDCIKAAKELNNGSSVRKEGFVVVDKNWHRVKIKSPEYLRAHHMWNNGNISKERLISLLVDMPDPIENVCAVFPSIAVKLKYYDYKLTELKDNIQQYMDYVRELYEEYNHDRKAVAMTIKDNKFAEFGFKAISRKDVTAKELFDNMTVSKICRFIPDYVEENIYG